MRRDEPVHRIVFGEQDAQLRQRRSGFVLRNARAARNRERCAEARGEPERRAFPELALDADLTAHQLHELPTNRQAQTRPATDALGREEWLDRAGERRLVHADPVVRDAEPDVAAGGDALWIVGADRGRLRQERQGTSSRHRVARIHREVEQGHFELIGIRPRGGQVRCSLDDDLYLRPRGTGDEVAHAIDQFGDFDRHELARNAEQLSNPRPEHQRSVGEVPRLPRRIDNLASNAPSEFPAFLFQVSQTDFQGTARVGWHGKGDSGRRGSR